MAGGGGSLNLDTADVEVVLFDAGGVLLVPDPAGITEVFRAFGGTEDAELVVRALYRAMAAAARSEGAKEAILVASSGVSVGKEIPLGPPTSGAGSCTSPP